MAVGVHIAGQQILAIVHLIAAGKATRAALLAQLIARGAGAVTENIASWLHLMIVQQNGHTASVLEHLIVTANIHATVAIAGKAFAAAAATLITIGIWRTTLQSRYKQKKSSVPYCEPTSILIFP